MISVLTEAKNHLKTCKWTFQQKRALFIPQKEHKSGAEPIPSFINKDLWPPFLQDLNLMDYSMWSLLETEVCAKTYKMLNRLKRSLFCA